jgi:hypothetical protein
MVVEKDHRYHHPMVDSADPSPGKLLYLIGNGAVENGWEPVLRALREFGDCQTVLDADVANLAMARLVYITRWTSAPHVQKAGDEETQKAWAARTKEHMEQVKGRICEHLRSAHERGELGVREQFDQVILGHYSPTRPQIAIVTTNWDRSVEFAVRKLDPTVPVHYLHGHPDEPRSIYFPSETADEPYHKDERQGLRELHGQLIHAINEADALVVYGLSLSALDAELSMIISAGTKDGRLRRIHVVDPSFRQVGARAATLVNETIRDKVEILGCHPEDMRTVWRFCRGATSSSQQWETIQTGAG